MHRFLLSLMVVLGCGSSTNSAENVQPNPGSGDKTISVVDPDARRGKCGQFFDGLMLDVMMDADSELVTALDVQLISIFIGPVSECGLS